MDALQEAIQFVLASDSEDEEIEERVRRPRFVRERLSHFDDLDDIDFVRRFRLSKRSALEVLDLIDHRLEFPTDKNDCVSPVNQLLLCLRYYATGSTQLVVSDFSGVSEATGHRIIHRVSVALASLYQQYVFFPRDEADIRRTQRDFYVIARFPRVIGAIDCSHIKIRSPGGDDAEYYRNRKGYMSLNCQAICNANLEFMDVVARWPGSATDITIFDNCYQRGMLENNRYGDSILVADSGYANRPYMMLPLGNPVSPEEILYNESQIRTRNPVERIFGVWKKRFPILALGISVRLENVQAIIIATAVLHNILRRAGDPHPPDDQMLNLPLPWDALIELGQMQNQNVEAQDPEGIERAPHRRFLINNYFRTLHQVHGN